MGSWLRVAHHPSASGLSDMTAMYHTTNGRQGVLVLHHTPPHREGQGRGERGHNDSSTSLPPPPTWRCLQPLPWHGYQGVLHHVGVVQHMQLQWATRREGHTKVSEGTHCMDRADKAPNGLNKHTCTVGRWEGRVQVG